MNLVVRIRRAFFDGLLADLRRPHPFAFERAGFLFAKRSDVSPSEAILFPVEYRAINDDDYVPDDTVGVTFNTASIRGALQRARSSREACLQVHVHEHRGVPHFSGVDVRTIDDLSRALRVVAPGQAHGGLVLSQDFISGRIWTPDGSKLARTRVTIVGFPFTLGPEA
jgi:hypothetical protein